VPASSPSSSHASLSSSGGQLGYDGRAGVSVGGEGGQAVSSGVGMVDAVETTD
jgi:hypothetical protein